MTDLSYVDVRSVLEKIADLGRELVLVGGQAVNFWASFYQGRVPALAREAPFTSNDIDFCGDELLDRRERPELQAIHALAPLRLVRRSCAMPGRAERTSGRSSGRDAYHAAMPKRNASASKSSRESSREATARKPIASTKIAGVMKPAKGPKTRPTKDAVSAFLGLNHGSAAGFSSWRPR